MNTPIIKETSNEKEKTLSTSSFYQQSPSFKRTHLSDHPSSLINEANIQQKYFYDSVENLQNIIESKRESVQKRELASREEVEKIEEEMYTMQNQVSGELKKMYKNDQTKEWAKQLQKSVHETVNSALSTKRRYEAKHRQTVNQYQRQIQIVDEAIRQEKKERQRHWDEVIDELGQTIIQYEQIISATAQNTQMSLGQLEEQLEEMEGGIQHKLKEEKKKRGEELSHMIVLLENVMNKLII